jgi:two-component system, NarL family, invasion response regulator UvrY
METKHIVLVDDHTLVRNGMKELIEKLGSYAITAQFDNGSDFLTALPLEPTPHLVMIDLSMPVMNGEELVETLKYQGNTIPLLVLTLNDDDATIIRLFRNGIRGYLKKNCTAETLGLALESILTSGYYHNEFLTLSLQTESGEIPPNDQVRVMQQLTSREMEFLKWVCHEQEYTYEQIADQMCVSKRTVDGYREALFDKFGIKSKTGLVLFVLKHRLLDQFS